MEKHAVVRTDLLAGTDVRSQLVSFKIAQNIDNGCIVKLEGLMEGERELYKATVPAANTPIDDLVIVATPEVMYDERLNGLDQFYNEANRACRGYRLNQSGIVSVTKEALDGKGSPAVGDFVEAKAGVKMNVVDKMTGVTHESTKIGKIAEIEKVGPYTYYVIDLK